MFWRVVLQNVHSDLGYLLVFLSMISIQTSMGKNCQLAVKSHSCWNPTSLTVEAGRKLVGRHCISQR